MIISTGTHAAVDGVPGLVEAQPLTHIEALELLEGLNFPFESKPSMRNQSMDLGEERKLA